MFPPSPNCCDDNLNPFHSLTFTTTSDVHQSPNYSKQDHHDPHPFLFNLPTPFFDEDELPLNQIFFQTHLMPAPPDDDPKSTADDHQTKEESTRSNSNHTSHPPVAVPGIVRRRNLGVVPRRRTGKKDRHSKICTAQGIRDRRMRLSLQVARKFFDLQDMLGYDKASKTIEWLFTKSKKAIKERTRDCNNKATNGDAKSEYFVSECEAVSNYDAKISTDPVPNLSPSIDIDPNLDETKSENKSRVKESRDKARARARCRAKEKMIIKESNPNLQKLGFSNIQFEGGDQQPQERVSPYVFNSQELSDLGTIDKLLGGNSSSTMSASCPLSDYDAAVSGYVDPNSNLMGFSGNNWDVLNSDRMNSIQYVFTNQVQLADNPNSIFLSTTNFP